MVNKNTIVKSVVEKVIANIIVIKRIVQYAKGPVYVNMVNENELVLNAKGPVYVNMVHEKVYA
jgi:hypothetical protein